MDFVAESLDNMSHTRACTLSLSPVLFLPMAFSTVASCCRGDQFGSCLGVKKPGNWTVFILELTREAIVFLHEVMVLVSSLSSFIAGRDNDNVALNVAFSSFYPKKEEK